MKSKLAKYRILLECMAIGLITGYVIAGFRVAIIKTEKIRNVLISSAQDSVRGAVITALVLLALAFIIALLLKVEPDIGGSGIPQLEGELKGQEDQCWWRVLLAKFAGCVLSIGGGLSLGREGPSVQLGAMVGKGWARCMGDKGITEERLMITCGAAAGLSAAFGAPLAGAVFSLEELHHSFSTKVLLGAMGSAAISDFVACEIVGLKPVFDFNILNALPHRYYLWVIVMGVVIGAVGVIYNRAIAIMQNIADRINRGFANKFGRGSFLAKLPSIIAIFAICYILIFVYPDAIGSGGSLPVEIAEGQTALSALFILLGAKFLYSTSSFGSGAPGGIFLPLLVLGAIVGGIFSGLASETVGISSIYAANFVIIGMAGMFAAIVRAPATGIVLISEMSGGMTSMLALVVVSLVAYTVAELMGGEPVYDQLLARRQRQRIKV